MFICIGSKNWTIARLKHVWNNLWEKIRRCHLWFIIGWIHGLSLSPANFRYFCIYIFHVNRLMLYVRGFVIFLYFVIITGKNWFIWFQHSILGDIFFKSRQNLYLNTDGDTYFLQGCKFVNVRDFHHQNLTWNLKIETIKITSLLQRKTCWTFLTGTIKLHRKITDA